MLKTDGARLLFSWLIPHLDFNGCFSGDPSVVNNKVFTRLNKTTKEVSGYLEDMQSVGLIVLYEINNDVFLYVPTFVEKQPYLNPDREAPTRIPIPSEKDLVGISLPATEKLPSKANSEVGFDTYWTGITEDDHRVWKEAYPACDIAQELKAMAAWIIANPAKGKKKNYRRFINNWLSRKQDKGGTRGLPGGEAPELAWARSKK
jgi:hypothetical protein